jgi:hypothetical protein
MASRGELVMRMVCRCMLPLAELETVTSIAEKNSSSTTRRSSPLSSQYFTNFGSMGVDMPVTKSLVARLSSSKLGASWILAPAVRVLRAVPLFDGPNGHSACTEALPVIDS